MSTYEPRSQAARGIPITERIFQSKHTKSNVTLSLYLPATLRNICTPSITQHKASMPGLFNIWLFIRNMQITDMILRGFYPQGGTLNNNWLDSSALPGRGEFLSKYQIFLSSFKIFQVLTNFLFNLTLSDTSHLPLVNFRNFSTLWAWWHLRCILQAENEWINIKQSSVSSYNHNQYIEIKTLKSSWRLSFV